MGLAGAIYDQRRIGNKMFFTPTTPKPGKYIPPPGKGIKQPTVDSKHMCE
jgi:hypothetical protein